MTIQKSLTYSPIDINGEILNQNTELKLTVVDKTGNYLVHKDIVRHLTEQRQGTSSTKNRSEVRGGGRKPWQQKGTGRARAGSNRSPLWKGGGVIFGPKPKKRLVKINNKERQLSLRTLLYNKKNVTRLIDGLETDLTSFKTKEFLKICRNCNIDTSQKILVVVEKKTVPLKLSIQNLPNVNLILASQLNSLALIGAKEIILTPLALKTIQEIYCD